MNNIRKKPIPKRIKTMTWDMFIGLNIGKTKCVCCNQNEITQSDFHCGHVVSQANLRPICSQCNLSMGKKNMIQWMNEHNLVNNIMDLD